MPLATYYRGSALRTPAHGWTLTAGARMAFAPPPHLRRRVAPPPDFYALGTKSQRQGNHALAMQQFTKLIECGRRNDDEIYAARGRSAQATGDHVRAVYDFSMAIRLKGDEPSHHTARAVSFTALHQIESLPGALRDHETAVELVSSSGTSASSEAVAGAHLARGLTLERIGRLPDALSDLNLALDALSRADEDERAAAAEQSGGVGGSGATAGGAMIGGALVRRGVVLRQLGRLEVSFERAALRH